MRLLLVPNAIIGNQKLIILIKINKFSSRQRNLRLNNFMCIEMLYHSMELSRRAKLLHLHNVITGKIVPKKKVFYVTGINLLN